MIVRCIKNRPTGTDLDVLGRVSERWLSQDFRVQVGAEYVVLAVFVTAGNETLGNGPFVQFRNRDGDLGEAPLALFEIVDGSISTHWQAVKFPNGALGLGPPSLLADFYREDYFEGVPEVVEDFERVTKLLDAEALSRENDAHR